MKQILGLNSVFFDWGLFDLLPNAQTVLQNGWNYIFQPQNRKKSAFVNFISYIHIDNVEYCPTLLTQWTQNLATNREEEGESNPVVNKPVWG